MIALLRSGSSLDADRKPLRKFFLPHFSSANLRGWSNDLLSDLLFPASSDKQERKTESGAQGNRSQPVDCAMDSTEDILRRITTYRRFLSRYRFDSSLVRYYEQLL